MSYATQLVANKPETRAAARSPVASPSAQPAVGRVVRIEPVGGDPYNRLGRVCAEALFKRLR
jgi:hypothetical protein